jgi:GntR family transcriptional regulator
MPFESFVAKAASELKKIILNSGSGNNKLPNENELAKQLHINRGTLRQALAILEYEGYIVRKQKTGTSINPYITDTGVRLEDINPIFQQIQYLGFTPRVNYQNFTYIPASKPIAKKLGINDGSIILFSQAEFYANDTPAALVHDEVPVHLIKKPMDIQNPGKSIFDFLDNYCDIKVKYEISDIIPIQCDQELSDFFRIPRHHALIQINSLVFDQENAPVMFTKLIFNDQIFNFSVIRRFINIE